MNYRTDRSKEILTSLTNVNFDKFENPVNNLRLYTLFDMDKTIKAKIFFEEDRTENPLGIYLSKLGLTQARIAETEKYNHVTKFFDCEYTGSIEGCDKFLIPSPKVATYDLKPEMSAKEITKKAINCLEKDYDFIFMNYANSDMVGHTGIYEAIEKAVVAIDNCVKDTVEAAKANGYEVIIIADHGNADHALNADGTPNTAHSLNPVPFVYVTENKAAQVENGVLADVAPSILHILGMAQPAEMTGKDLIMEN